MPEAELPGNENFTEINDPVNQEKLDYNNELDEKEQNLSPELQISPEDDEWETVNFPNAISVDSIPVLETTSAEPQDLILTNQDQIDRKSQEVLELPEVPVVLTKDSTEELESTNLMEALHDCNRELVNRVTELETALEECQKNSRKSRKVARRKN